MKMKEWSKKKKIVTGIITFACVGLLIGGSMSVYASNKAKAETERVYQENKKILKTLNKELIAMLDKEDQNYLVEGITSEQVKAICNKTERTLDLTIDGSKQTLEQLEPLPEKIITNYKRIENSFSRQEAINSLYQSSEKEQAIDGKTLKKDLAIADDLKKEKVAEVKDLYFVKDTKSDYEQVINAFVATAEEQLTQIEKAKAAVGKVYKDNKIVSADQKLYDPAKNEVEKIKNAKAKKELQSMLGKVKSEIDKVEVKKQEEQKIAEANAAKEKNESQSDTDIVQNQAPTDNGATDANNYVPQEGASNGYQEPQYQAPEQQGGQASTPQTPSNGGGQTTPPANNNGNNVHVNPEDIQGSEKNNTGGTNEWWGWD